MVRDKKGRFIKGHPNVGAGRKPKSQEETLIQAAFSAVSPEAVKDIMQVLERKAKGGNLVAIKLYLAYTIGEPVQKTELTGTSDMTIRFVWKDNVSSND